MSEVEGLYCIDRQGDAKRPREEESAEHRNTRCKISLSAVLQDARVGVPLASFVEQERKSRLKGGKGRDKGKGGGSGAERRNFQGPLTVTVTDYSSDWAHPPNRGMHGLWPKPHIRLNKVYTSLRLSGFCLLEISR
jgi:hypothetical protein